MTCHGLRLAVASVKIAFDSLVFAAIQYMNLKLSDQMVEFGRWIGLQRSAVLRWQMPTPRIMARPYTFQARKSRRFEFHAPPFPSFFTRATS
jgi:hypothetical protein